MHITTTIDHEHHIRKHKIVGSFTYKELADELQKIYTASDKQKVMDVLWDLREADFSAFSSAEVQQVAQFVGRHWGARSNARAALVVSGNLEFGLSRMYGTLLSMESDSTVNVFRDLQSAEKWLFEQSDPL